VTWYLSPSLAEGVFMPETRALIFANGEQLNIPAVQQLLQPDDFLVAADGGLRHLLSLGRMPHLLIGDLDSVSPAEIDRVVQAGVLVQRYPVHKDETDLELALLAAKQQGCTEMIILAALGGRLDMTLGNIALLLLPELAGCSMRLEDGVEEVFFIQPGVAGRVILGRAGERVSLLPWGGSAEGIHTEGLYYPLRGETLYPERSRGISNQMLGKQALVIFESGLLVCIHTRENC
jgi:thiamine pyrophosphokinase